MEASMDLLQRFPNLQNCRYAIDWLEIRTNLQAPRNTILSYAYDLSDFLSFCLRHQQSVFELDLRRFAEYVKELSIRNGDRLTNRRNRRTIVGLSPATRRRRISTVRQFYDYLVGEGACKRNPARVDTGGIKRFVPTVTDLPWIPTEEQWDRIINVVKGRPLRDRTMFAVQYDGGLRKEELCSLRLSDIDHASRTIRIRPETTKNRRVRIVPYGQATDNLLTAYQQSLPLTVGDDETFFRSLSTRNAGTPITSHTWTKVVTAIAREAGLRQLHSHTLRHLCLTDLARSGWDIVHIRGFAGHRSVRTTETYIQLSGRDLADQYQATLTGLHAQRVTILALTFTGAIK
jgi:integrase/recombinase XerD